jgi:hypothetical protein
MKEMDGKCSTHGIDYHFWSENPKGRDNLEDVGVVERIILRWILRKEEPDHSLAYHI